MYVTFVRFAVCGEPDNRRYELTIGMDREPAVVEETGSNTAFYLDQVQCYFYVPDEGEDSCSCSILITLHQGINPGYDLAVRRLVGDALADIIQHRLPLDGGLGRRLQTRGDMSYDSMLQILLEERIDEAKASKILNRALRNSTFA